MKSLPIDTIVKVKEYGIGIIVDVLYSSKLYRISFQGEEYLIRFNDAIPYENIDKKGSEKEISKSINSNNKRKVIEKPQERINKPSTIESGDFVYNHIYGHGLVIRKIGDEDLFDCKFGKIRIYLKSEYLTKEDYVTSNNFYRTSPVQTNDDLEYTYIDALWEFDPDSIILNRICFNGISIITSENTKDGRVQVGVNQWAYVPTLITNIKKVLEIISTTLNIEVEIHEI